MSKTCPRCGHENPAGVAICANCATPLANLCPNCGFENPTGFKFCGNCGTNLLTASMARASDPAALRRLQGYIPTPLVDKILNASKQIEGERRTVTVLFSDVVGFTTISEKLDPETVYSIIDGCVQAFREQIYAHEGTLDKFMGDGVMALFGAPVAHEDDPARALRCALGMQDALKKISSDLVARHGIQLQMRIGLNLGTVVVGDIGSDLRMNYTALGDTVNVAARLQSVAEPGAILVSRAVYEQTRALFEFRELGSIRVKGRVEPVEIFEVNGTKREPGRVRGIPGLHAPMVGREKELARVKGVVQNLVEHGRGGGALVTGEAGMGKSRLTSELKQATTGLQLGVFEGGCVAYGQSAYDVIVKVLSAFFKIQSDDPPAVASERVQTRINGLFSTGEERLQILPYILNLLGLPLVEREMADRIRHLEPAQLRQQTFLAVRDLLLAAAQRQPLLLIFEDLHWVDKPSLDLLLFLFNAVESAPIVLFCISRPANNQAAPQIQRIGAATLGERFVHIPLEPLSLQDSAALIDLLLTISDLPESLRQMIPQRAEGNPFYLEEIIRMLIDRNLIQRRNDRWEMTPGADVNALQVPRTLEGLIMTRVDNLPESTRHVAQCASVIGRDFSDGLLRHVVNGQSPRLDGDLQELLDHELVRQTVEQPDRQYAFRHILTQQTIYNSVLLRRREQLHHKIGAAIEDLYHDRLDEQSERLAFHYTESKDAARALPYVIRAAERAAARFANEEALSFYHSALELATKSGAPAEQRVRILVGLGDAQTFVGDFESASASLRTALDLARTAAATPAEARLTAEIERRLGRVYERRAAYDEAMRWLEAAMRDINRDSTSGHAVERVRIYLDIGWVQYRIGKLDEAEHWRLRATEISEGYDYYAEIGSAYNGLAAIAYTKGDWQHAIEYAQQGLAVRETLGDIEGVSRSHSNLGAILLTVGEWDRALMHLTRSVELKQRIGDAKYLAQAYNNLAYYYLYKGDMAKARELFTSARKDAEKIRALNSICLALNGLAQTHVMEREFPRAVELLKTSIATARETGGQEPLAEALWVLAEAEVGQGAVSAARGAAQESLQMARDLGIRQTEANAFRVLGTIECASQKWGDADTHLKRSVAIFTELQNAFEAARAELELALLEQARGAQAEARQLLERCLATFTRLGAEVYRARTEAALAQPASEAAPPRLVA